MKLCFSIDALSSSADSAWRLQDDQQSWRPCTFAEPLSSTDARLSEHEQVASWHGRRLKREHDQLVIQQRPGRFDFLVRGIFSHAILHRLSSAPLPEKKQMIDQFRKHDSGTAWMIYLNASGQFCMLNTSSDKIIGNLHIAVRGEITSSETYVGELAADNTIMMDEIFHQFLAGWLEHLGSSRMGVFIPDAKTLRPLDEYEQAIEQWQPETTV